MKNIILIGMPGCGKSTIAKLIAEKLQIKCIDLDASIEAQQNKSISQIFRDEGEELFRKLESDMIKKLSILDNAVISTGGGAVLDPDNIKCLKSCGTVVFIDRPVNLIINDIQAENRPLLADGKERLYVLHQQRLPIYKHCADIAIQNDKPLYSVTEQIIAEVCEFENTNN